MAGMRQTSQNATHIYVILESVAYNISAPNVIAAYTDRDIANAIAEDGKYQVYPTVVYHNHEYVSRPVRDLCIC